MEVLIEFVHLFFFLHIIDAYQRGVVLRWGVYHRPAEPGRVWHWPFRVERVIGTNVIPSPLLVGPQPITTQDGKRAIISALFVITVDDPKAFLLGLEGGHTAALMLCSGVLANFVARSTWADLASWLTDDEGDKKKKPPSHDLAKMARARLKQYGIGVADAQITQLVDARSIMILGMDAARHTINIT